MRRRIDRSRRRTLLLALSLGMLAAAPHAAVAQPAWPNKPIRFIVPYPAGATTDLVARTVGQRVGALLGQPVIVENMGGAGGNIGMAALARAAPDGYTIGMGAISTNALNPHVYKSMNFDPRKDFTAVGMLGAATAVLVAGPAEPARTVAELVARARVTPGGLAYATPGIGTALHFAGVMFSQISGAPLMHVPYKGSAPAVKDVLGGQVGLMFDNLPSALPHIRSGRLRALAVTTEQRSPLLPQVPTLRESGFEELVVAPWFAVFAPAGAPAAVVERLNQAFNAALADPAVRQPLIDAGFNPAGSSPQALESLARSEWLRFEAFTRKTPISVE